MKEKDYFDYYNDDDDEEDIYYEYSKLELPDEFDSVIDNFEKGKEYYQFVKKHITIQIKKIPYEEVVYRTIRDYKEGFSFADGGEYVRERLTINHSLDLLLFNCKNHIRHTLTNYDQEIGDMQSDFAYEFSIYYKNIDDFNESEGEFFADSGVYSLVKAMFNDEIVKIYPEKELVKAIQKIRNKNT